jgi:DNA-binding beta-propeller fold protein YncE
MFTCGPLRSFLSSAIILSSFISAAQFNGPESVEYDPVGDRYFVSNTQSASIKVLQQDGTVSDFATGLPNAPYGLEIMDGVLYACMGSGVRGYALETGAEVYYRDIGAQFPNGITTDGTHLYITAFQGNRIYKVDPVGDTHSTLVNSTGGTPNGIVYDPLEQRLVVAFWGSNAPIKQVDPVIGSVEHLVLNSGLNNIDGITIDCHGNFITSSWGPTSRITRWDPAFAGPGVDMNIAGLANPADLDFDHVNNRIAIPNSGSGTVLLHDVDCTTGLTDRRQEPAIMVIPNPVRDLMHIQPAFKKAEPYIILDARGLLIGGGTLQPNAMIDMRRLAAGTYVLHFTEAGRHVKLVKE